MQRGFKYSTKGDETTVPVGRSQIMFIFGQPDEKTSEEKYKLYDLTEPFKEITQSGRLVTVDLRKFKDENQKIIAKHILARLNKFSDSSLEERIGPFLSGVTRRFQNDPKFAKSVDEKLREGHLVPKSIVRDEFHKPQHTDRKVGVRNKRPYARTTVGTSGPYSQRGKVLEESTKSGEYFGSQKPRPYLKSSRPRRFRPYLKPGSDPRKFPATRKVYRSVKNSHKKPKTGSSYKLPSSYVKEFFHADASPHFTKHGPKKNLPELYTVSNFDDLPAVGYKHSGSIPTTLEDHEGKADPPVYFYDKPKYFHHPKPIENYKSHASSKKEYTSESFSGRVKADDHFGIPDSSEFRKDFSGIKEEDVIHPPVRAVVKHGKSTFEHPTVTAMIRESKKHRRPYITYGPAKINPSLKRNPAKDSDHRRGSRQSSLFWFLQQPVSFGSWLG